MQGPTFIPPGHVSNGQAFGVLLQRYAEEWRQTRSGSPQDPTNSEALEYVFDQYLFQMRAINKVVLLGWADPGTTSDQRTAYNNEPLIGNRAYFLRLNMKRLAIAQQILEFIKQRFPMNGVKLYVCGPNLSQDSRARLRELGIHKFEEDDPQSPNYINRNSLVYDVNRNPVIFRDSVVLRDQGLMDGPAVVLTLMDSYLLNNDLDHLPWNTDSLSDLLEKYWLAPLMHIIPPLFTRAELMQIVDWAQRQQWQSRITQEFYIGRNQQFAFVGEQGMIMLCRKDRRRNHNGDPVQDPQPQNPQPQNPQPQNPQPQQQQPEYRQGGGNWAVGGFGGPGGFEGAH